MENTGKGFNELKVSCAHDKQVAQVKEPDWIDATDQKSLKLDSTEKLAFIHLLSLCSPIESFFSLNSDEERTFFVARKKENSHKKHCPCVIHQL